MDAARDIDSLLQAVRLDPLNPDRYNELAKELEEYGKLDEALALFVEAQKLRPTNHVANNAIRRILVKQGRIDRIQAEFGNPNAGFSVPSYLLNLRPDAITTCRQAKGVKRIDVTVPQRGPFFIPPARSPNLAQAQIRDETISAGMLVRTDSAETFVAIVANGRIYADWMQSAIFSENGQLLSDVSTGNSALLAASPHLQPAVRASGRALALSARNGTNYSHWLVDIFPGIHLVQQAGIDLREIDWFVVNTVQEFHRESFERLGIPLERVVVSELLPHLQFDELIVPSPQIGFCAWMGEFLNSTFSGEEEPRSNRRLYISRADAQSRRVLNEQEILNLLPGFEVVTLTGRTITEQAELFRSAEIIVTPHGAGLTNLVFARPGTKIIEFFYPSFLCGTFAIIAMLRGLEHVCIMTNIAKTVEHYRNADLPWPGDPFVDIFVEPHYLQHALNMVGWSSSHGTR